MIPCTSDGLCADVLSVCLLGTSHDFLSESPLFTLCHECGLTLIYISHPINRGHNRAKRKSFFFFFFSFLFFLTTGWNFRDFSHGKFELFSPGKASCDRVALPMLRSILGVFSVSLVHRTLTWTTGPFNVRADVNACDCTGWYGHRKRACSES